MTLDKERKTMPLHEMTIPKSRGEILWIGFVSLIVVVFALLAFLNLANHVAIIPSVIWLLFVTWILWSGCREAGSVRMYLTDWLAAFAARKFVMFPPETTHQAFIRFGYELFGRRFYQKDIEIERIESVEWSPGQATSMAGRDMKDWSVALWYDHGDPERSKNHHMLRKPDQDVYIIGPSKRKEVTAILGREFISFLNAIGVHLTQGSEDTIFSRRTQRQENIQQGRGANALPRAAHD